MDIGNYAGRSYTIKEYVSVASGAVDIAAY